LARFDWWRVSRRSGLTSALLVRESRRRSSPPSPLADDDDAAVDDPERSQKASGWSRFCGVCVCVCVCVCVVNGAGI